MDATDVSSVLVVGGDAATRTMLRFLLGDEGREIVEVATPDALVATLRARMAGLVVVVEDGLIAGSATMTLLRQAGHYPSVVLLTRNADQTARRRAFALGALDIIGLPSSPRDLCARLNAALGDRRRIQAMASSQALHAGGLTLRSDSREVSDGTGWSAHLTARETALLRALMSAPGHSLGRQDLLDYIWGERYEGDGNALEVYVRRLRAKLVGATSRSFVRTLRGQGYLFDAREAPRATAPVESAPHVLYVGDVADPHALETLRQAGYIGAHEVGERALAGARRLQPMLILIDRTMAGMTIVELCRCLRADARTANIPVIVCATASYLRACRAELTANDYLVTPFDRDELLLRVEKLIGLAPAAALSPAAPA